MKFLSVNFYALSGCARAIPEAGCSGPLKNASVGLYSDFANSHDPILRRESEASVQAIGCFTSFASHRVPLRPNAAPTIADVAAFV